MTTAWSVGPRSAMPMKAGKSIGTAGMGPGAGAGGST